MRSQFQEDQYLIVVSAKATGQSLEKVAKDVDRDYFMSADEAKKYGIVDQVYK